MLKIKYSFRKCNLKGKKETFEFLQLMSPDGGALHTPNLTCEVCFFHLFGGEALNLKI